ncbi:hypothetical protein F5141DRAFT_285556 [Pisolithus sp. B1]|nr:hypothetical protein F5141DRAFT_285556 [Pisolithus sp. B1]
MWRGLCVTAAADVPFSLRVVVQSLLPGSPLDLSNEARPLADKVNAVMAIELGKTECVLPATLWCHFYRVLCRQHVRRDIRRVLWCIVSPLLPVSGFVFFCSRPVALCHVTWFFFCSSGLFCQTSPSVCIFSDNSLLGVVIHTVDICGEGICQIPPYALGESRRPRTIRCAVGSIELFLAIKVTSVPREPFSTTPRLAQSVYGSADERTVSMSGRSPPGKDVVKEVMAPPSLG